MQRRQVDPGARDHELAGREHVLAHNLATGGVGRSSDSPGAAAQWSAHFVHIPALRAHWPGNDPQCTSSSWWSALLRSLFGAAFCDAMAFPVRGDEAKGGGGGGIRAGNLR